jgi:pyridoxine 4-dehydrogenase
VSLVARTVKLGAREITRVGLGTNRLSETSHHIEFIRDAVEAGVGLIDTAHLYTGGSSERTIGAALAATAAADRVMVATKGGFSRGGGRPNVLRSQIEQSLASLQTERIDLYYLHRVDPDTPLEDSLRTIGEFRERGAIDNVGLSQVTVAQIERARAIVTIAAVQSHFNVGERGWDDVVDYCTREGIVFVPFYPLRGEHGALAAIARAHGTTEPQIALAWLLQRSPLMLPIPGTLSLAHARDNVAALEIELSEAEYAALT